MRNDDDAELVSKAEREALRVLANLLVGRGTSVFEVRVNNTKRPTFSVSVTGVHPGAWGSGCSSRLDQASAQALAEATGHKSPSGEDEG
jgi:hypothetical protein